MKSRTRTASLSFLLAALVGVESASARQPRSPSTEAVREVVDVDIVNLAVRVTDRRGEPIMGLEVKDFEVLENGVEVEPSNFLELRSEAQHERTIWLTIYLDEHNLRSANRDRALAELTVDLEPLFGRHRLQAMVASYDSELKVVQAFTDDWPTLNRALAQLAGRPSVGDDRDAFRRSTQQSATSAFQKARGTDRLDRQNAALGIDALLGEMKTYARQEHEDTEGSLRALGTFVRSLAWQDGQKLVLYVTDGLAARPLDGFLKQAQNLISGGASSSGDLVESRSGGQSDAAPGGGGGVFSRDASMELGRFQQAVEPFRSIATIEALVAEANTYGVTLLAAMPPPGDAAASGRRSQGRGSLLELSDMREALHMLGDGTGGLARTTETSLVGFLPRALGNSESHYSLGISAAGKAEGEYTAFEVRVKKRGAQAQYRHGYVKKSVGARLSDRALAALLLGVSDNPHLLEAHIDEMKLAEPQQATEPELFDVQIRVEIPIKSLKLVSRDGVHAADARMVVVAMDDDDQLTAAQHLSLPLEIPDDALGSALGSHYRATINLRLPGGPQRVALGLWDSAAGSGSVLTDRLTVGPR